ncbi:MAG: sn-glycerol-1-phosphate dehydrogenase [Treponema sp.]|nr:sn-glycerol-1-phosphate dehydrogenase [Treponema sp.]
MTACLAAADQTKAMIVREGVLAEIPSLLEAYFPGAAVFLAADENTFRAAGSAVLEIIQDSGAAVAGTYVFPGRWIHAEYGHVEILREKFHQERESSRSLVPLAVGAGTINDLVKRAASELGLPYFCIPTAASVDGYTAYGASLLCEGFKQTLPCEAPLVVAADTAILTAAPAFLSSSGFGDLAGKIIAGTDWIIADSVFALGGMEKPAPGTAAVDPKAWNMVQIPLKNELARSAGAARGDREGVKTLFESLGITGFALQYMKDSRAISGCEHMWSHVWEMENLSFRGAPVTHGHKVALGTLAAAAFTECLFAEKPDPPAGGTKPGGGLSWADRETAVRRAFAGLDRAMEAALKTSRAKFMEDGEQSRRLRGGILDHWENIKKAVFEKLPPYGELRQLLKEAGCPVTPAETGLTRERVIATARKAQMMRNRFTVLDLAFETGVFEDVLKRMENSDTYLV